jgi:hypothetical protein
MRARTILLLGLSLLACSSSTTSTPNPTPDGTGTPPPGGDTPPAACDPGTYRDSTAANACHAFPALTVARSPVAITPVRDHHSASVIETNAGPYLYVVGGTDAWNVIHLDVQRAKIHDDGTLDPFETLGNLPEPRAGQCMAKLSDDHWLHAGGTWQKNGQMGTTDTTLILHLDAAGKIADIASGPKLPVAVMHLTCDVSNGWVYAMGGRGQNSVSTTMSARAKIQPDGTLGAFESQTKLNPDRSHHAAFIRQSRLFLVGGFTGNPIGNAGVDRSDIVYADIAADGTLGAWKSGGKLPAPLSVSSSQLYEDAVYVFGGLDDTSLFSDAIQRATFQDDGTLAPFQTLKTKLPDARGHVHDTPMYKSFVYSVGGQDDGGNSLGTVDIGSFAN